MEPTWAIVELMGHNVIAGEISEQVIAGVAMLRVDVPACEEQPAYTKFYSGSAVYGITPTDEATAARAVNRLRIAPIAPYIVAPVNGTGPERQLQAPMVLRGVEDDNPYPENNEVIDEPEEEPFDRDEPEVSEARFDERHFDEAPF